MKPLIKLNQKYLLLTILLFITEVLIATIFKNIFWLRAYFGDVLAVIGIYTLIFSFFSPNKMKTIIYTFIFACAIEFLQYFHFAEILGFKNNKLIMIVLGNSFSWIDMMCYLVGCLFIYFLEKLNVDFK